MLITVTVSQCHILSQELEVCVDARTIFGTTQGCVGDVNVWALLGYYVRRF